MISCWKSWLGQGFWIHGVCCSIVLSTAKVEIVCCGGSDQMWECVNIIGWCTSLEGASFKVLWQRALFKVFVFFLKVKRLNRLFGDSLRWYVQMGLRAWFKAQAIKNVIELDWWQEIEDMHSGLKITFTPCQHWSARSIWDRKKSLWGSYLVQGQAGKVLGNRTQRYPLMWAYCYSPLHHCICLVYGNSCFCTQVWFGGDTGYCNVFKEIGDKYGPIDLALIPTGAYNPRWFMK